VSKGGTQELVATAGLTFLNGPIHGLEKLLRQSHGGAYVLAHRVLPAMMTHLMIKMIAFLPGIMEFLIFTAGFFFGGFVVFFLWGRRGGDL
jgi:hypothetical protein